MGIISRSKDLTSEVSDLVKTTLISYYLRGVTHGKINI